MDYIPTVETPAAATDTRRMLAISLWQPWASLLVTGEKRYETRHWKPNALRPGDRVVVHAAKRYTAEERAFARRDFLPPALERHGIDAENMPLGALLGIVEYVGCHKVETIGGRLSDQEKAFGNYADGRYAWEFKAIEVFDTPIPYRGQQGLFSVSLPTSPVSRGLNEDETPTTAPTAVKQRYQEARAVGEEMLALLKPYCQRIEIGGSVRRRKALVKDVELVAIPGPELLLYLDDMITRGEITYALYGKRQTKRWGKKMRGMMRSGVKVELFLTDEDGWGYQFWLRTGPGDAGEYVMGLINFKDAPFRFRDGHGVTADGRKLRLADEQAMFDLLGLRYVEPEDRTRQFYRIGMGYGHKWGDPEKYVIREETLIEAPDESVGRHQPTAEEALWWAGQRAYMDDLAARRPPTFEQIWNRITAQHHMTFSLPMAAYSRPVPELHFSKLKVKDRWTTVHYFGVKCQAGPVNRVKGRW